MGGTCAVARLLYRFRPMEHNHGQSNHYVHLGIMALLSFAAMCFLMSAMVDSIGSVYMSVNQVYMAALMTAPMVVIELLVMRSMYSNAGLNAAHWRIRHSRRRDVLCHPTTGCDW